MKVISFIAKKGGAGKTTLSANLAITAQIAGKDSAVIDTDRDQYSTWRWGQLRQDKPPAMISIHVRELETVLQTCKKGGAKLVTIDTPPTKGQEMLEAARWADLVVIPTKPTAHYLANVVETVKVIEGVARRWCVVIVDCYPSSFDGARSAETLQKAYEIDAKKICPVYLSGYRAWSHSENTAQGVEEFEPDGNAAEEMRAFYAWIQRMV